MHECTNHPTQITKDPLLDSIPVGYTSIPDEIKGETLFRECDLEHMEEDACFLIKNIGNGFMQW